MNNPRLNYLLYPRIEDSNKSSNAPQMLRTYVIGYYIRILILSICELAGSEPSEAPRAERESSVVNENLSLPSHIPP